MNDYEFEIPKATCPKCGAVYDDYEARGVIHCDECGYCVHPVIYGDRCIACGETLSPEELDAL